MSSARLTSIFLSGAVGYLCAGTYDAWTSILVTLGITLGAGVIGVIFGDDT